jgi:hypothetical protein
MKLPSMVLAASIFSITIGISYYGLSERIFIFTYWNCEYRTGKLETLSDYLISDTKLKLSDYRISDIKKTIDCPALEMITTSNKLAGSRNLQIFQK